MSDKVTNIQVGKAYAIRDRAGNRCAAVPQLGSDGNPIRNPDGSYLMFGHFGQVRGKKIAVLIDDITSEW